MERQPLDAEAWSLVNRLLDQALDLPEAQRDGWLAGLGPEHRPYLDTLRDLLARERRSSPLDALPPVPAGPEPTQFASGERVGPYRLVRPLGEGGMGTVWLAERTDVMTRRPVALKLPHTAWRGRALAERLAREREILATLSHPHIARLLDAGLGEDGQPYLALELVEGQPIDAYVRERRSPLGERLELFLQVCDAVAHAHGRLVVHRDLKPSNILVTADGQVRLLDFGIAKLLEGPVAIETELTETAGRALTPNYASPEQLAGEPVGVASDVYSLGIVLYQLLTGRLPYQLRREPHRPLSDALETVEVTRPSEAAPDAAMRRALRGDLDTVVAKALKRRTEERYPTANALADDIRRHLGGRPVEARPDRALYRLRKAIQRHRTAAVAAALVTISVLAGTAAAVWQARVARAEARRAEEVKTFITDIFREADPYARQGRSLSGVELLKLARSRLGRLGDVQPALRVELLDVLGTSLLGLGDTDAAEEVSREALGESSRLLSADDPLALRACLLSTDVHRVRGRAAELDAELRSLLPLLRQHARRQPEDLVHAMENEAHLAIDQDRGTDAVRIAREAFDLARRILGDSHPRTVDAAGVLADDYQYAESDPTGAVVAAEEALRFTIRAYPDQPAHPRIIHAREVYGRSLSQAGLDDRALEEWKHALSDARAVLGPTSRAVGQISANMVPGQRRLGYLREALENATVGVEIERREVSAGSSDWGVALTLRGVTYLAARKGPEALEDLTTATQVLTGSFGPENGNALTARMNRALALGYVGRLAEARSEAAAALVLYEKTMPLWLLYGRLVSGTIERLAGAPARAREHLEAALALVRDDGLRDWNRLRVLTELALTQLDLGQLDEAQASLTEGLALSAQQQRVDSPMRADLWVGEGRLLLARGHPADAVPVLERADDFWRSFDPANRVAVETHRWLARARSAIGVPRNGPSDVRRGSLGIPGR